MNYAGFLPYFSMYKRENALIPCRFFRFSAVFSAGRYNPPAYGGAFHLRPPAYSYATEHYLILARFGQTKTASLSGSGLRIRSAA